MKKGTLLILDDDPGRHEFFTTAASDYDVVHTYEVTTFAEAVKETKELVLVSLDHDLTAGANRGRSVKGCGCDAAELVNQHVAAHIPVLIHSANDMGSQAMRAILVRAGRSGRVSRMNFETIMDQDERAGITLFGDAVAELTANPCWPDDVTSDELIALLGDNPWATCPTRAAKEAAWRSR